MHFIWGSETVVDRKVLFLIFQSHNVGTLGSSGFPSWTAGWKVFSQDEMWPIIKLRIEKIVEKEDSLQDSTKMAMNTISVRFVIGMDG